MQYNHVEIIRARFQAFSLLVPVSGLTMSHDCKCNNSREALILTIKRPRLFESSRFHGARIDDARIKRGQRVQGSFLDALQDTCNNQQKSFEMFWDDVCSSDGNIGIGR